MGQDYRRLLRRKGGWRPVRDNSRETGVGMVRNERNSVEGRRDMGVSGLGGDDRDVTELWEVSGRVRTRR